MAGGKKACCKGGGGLSGDETGTCGAKYGGFGGLIGDGTAGRKRREALGKKTGDVETR